LNAPKLFLMTLSRYRLIGLAAVAVVTVEAGFVTIPTAHAEEGASSQASRKAAARGLFEEGVRLLSEQKWAAAADRFERARTLQPSPRVTYNLSSALTEMGRFVYASELLRELVNTQQIEPALQDAAKVRLNKIQAQIAGLVVMVEGDTTAAEITLDGRVIDMVLLSVPVPVDPGEHRLVVRRAGKEVLTREIRISEGENQKIHLALPARPIRDDVTDPVPVAATPIQTNDPEPIAVSEVADKGPGDGNHWLWVGGATIAVAAGIALFFVLRPEQVDPVKGEDGMVTFQ
jgi:hypothetical protein